MHKTPPNIRLSYRGEPDQRVNLAGVTFDNVTMNEAISRIDDFVQQSKPRMVVTPNVDHVLRLQKDKVYAKLVAQADLVLVDSQPLVKLSRMVRRPLKERVAGSDLFPELCGHCARTGRSVFFMGGDPGTADKAAEILKLKYPTLRVTGTYCPPFGFERCPEQNRKVIEAVRSARPDVLFVGLGSPKQERWIATHKDHYGVPVSIGIGISFSFMSGRVKRAPIWMQSAGLEWFHRLVSEPRRLWARYMVRGMGFLPLLVGELWAAHIERTGESTLPAESATEMPGAGFEPRREVAVQATRVRRPKVERSDRDQTPTPRQQTSPARTEKTAPAALPAESTESPARKPSVRTPVSSASTNGSNGTHPSRQSVSRA